MKGLLRGKKSAEEFNLIANSNICGVFILSCVHYLNYFSGRIILHAVHTCTVHASQLLFSYFSCMYNKENFVILQAIGII